jgi:hypothetical protein
MTIENARGVKIAQAKVGTPVPGQKAEKIKPPSAVRLRSEEKKIEKKHGPLVPSDKGVHTVATADGEVDLRLDKQEYKKMGYAERVVTQEFSARDNDDPEAHS